jgi:hypothetical protein
MDSSCLDCSLNGMMEPPDPKKNMVDLGADT